MTFNYCELGLQSRPNAMSGAPQGISGLKKNAGDFYYYYMS